MQNRHALLSFNQRYRPVLTAYSMVADCGAQVPRSKGVPVYIKPILLAIFCYFSKRVKVLHLGYSRVANECHSGWGFSVIALYEKRYYYNTFHDLIQCGISINVDSHEPVQPPFKLRNSK